MEDERGAGGHSDSGGVSEPPLSGKLVTESVVENMGSDNRVEEVFEDGDGEEIMVEVVGSDVFVDGVSGNGEEDCAMEEAGELEGGVVEKNEESRDVLGEGDGHKMDESGLGSRDEKLDATEDVDTSLSMSIGSTEKVSALPVRGVGGVDEEWNPGIEVVDRSLMEANVTPAEVAGVSPMDISGEKETKGETVDRVISDLVTVDSSNHPAEVAGVSPMDICEEKETMGEAVDKVISDLATVESSNQPLEAVSDEKADIGEEKEILPSSDISISQDRGAVDSGRSCGETEETHDGNDGVVGQVNSVNASAGGEHQDSGTRKDDSFRVEVECPSTDGDSGRSFGETEETHDGNDGVVGQVNLVNASAGGEHQDSATRRDDSFSVGVECQSTDGDSGRSCAETEETHDGNDGVVGQVNSVNASAGGEHQDSATRKDDSFRVGVECPSTDGDSGRSCGETEETHDGNDGVVGQINSVNASAGGEHEDSATRKDDSIRLEVECPSTDGDSGRSFGENEETHDGNDGVIRQVNSVNASAGGEHQDSATRKDDSIRLEVECPSTDGDFGRSSAEAEETHDGNDVVIGQVNASAGGEHQDSATRKDDGFRVEGECRSSDVDSGLQGKSVLEDVGEKNVSAVESEDLIPKPSAPTDNMDESENCSDDLHGAKLEPNDQTDGASHAGPESVRENSCDTLEEKTVGNDECSKTEGDIEAVKAQNEIITSTAIQLADGVDAAEVSKDDCLNVEAEDDAEENLQSNTSMSGSKNEEIVLSDSGICSDQPVISPTVGAEMGDRDQNVVTPLVNDVGRGGSGEQSMEIDSVILGKSLAGHGSAEVPMQGDATENLPLPKEAVDTADAMVTEDPTTEGVANIGKCGSPQSTKEVADHGADELEKTKMMPNEVTAVTADSDTAQVSIIPEGNGSTEMLLCSTDIPLLDGGGNEENSDEVFKSREADEMPRESNGFYAAEALEGHISEAKPMEVEEERDSDETYHAGPDVDAETATEGPSFESDKLKMSSEEMAKYDGCLRMKQAGYLKPPEDEGCFTPSDLVWGKVRSHPWWPGQIFDQGDASEKAVKHYKKDSYLVAYFGDQTFAWNDSSALKPFRSYFSQIEKQSNSESFHNAVDCALEEVERRVQLGLSCSCTPKDDYATIETQVLENTGIREESSQRHGVDQSSCASCFEPSELLEFIRTAAPCASSGADRLDLVIARAQLSAFCSFKGYGSPIEFPSSGELLESDADTEQISDEAVASHKLRHVPKEVAQSRKERSLIELMGDGEYSPDAEDESVAGDLGKSTGKKRKALDPLAEGSDKRLSVSAAKAPAPASQTPKPPSFKIGECIRRVANSLVKGSNDEIAADGSPSACEPSEKQSAVVTAEALSVSEMLSQLELVALDPKRRRNAPNQIRAFFMGYRSSTALSRRGRKKKSEQAVGGSGEEFEFDDVNDSYWTDRIVQNYSAEQLLHERTNGADSHQLVSFNVDKTSKAGRKPHSRKRFSSMNSPTSAPEFDESAKRIKQETSPAELILSFAERNRIPSEINLNKMFRRFGALMESETEVDHESGSAKVIFKRGSDAEVARNSAEKFAIFGPVVVSYQIGYSPVISVKILPVSLPQSHEETAALMI